MPEPKLTLVSLNVCRLCGNVPDRRPCRRMEEVEGCYAMNKNWHESNGNFRFSRRILAEPFDELVPLTKEEVETYLRDQGPTAS